MGSILAVKGLPDEGGIFGVGADESDVRAGGEGLFERLFFVGGKGEPFLGGHKDLVETDVGAPVGRGLGEIKGGGDEARVGGLNCAPVFGVERVAQTEERVFLIAGVVAGLRELHHRRVDAGTAPGELGAPSVVEIRSLQGDEDIEFGLGAGLNWKGPGGVDPVAAYAHGDGVECPLAIFCGAIVDNDVERHEADRGKVIHERRDGDAVPCLGVHGDAMGKAACGFETG